MRILNSGTLALTLLLSITSGLGFMMFGVWIRILQDTHGYSLEILSAATSGILIVSGLIGLLIGRMMRRHDARWIIGFGGLMGSLALLLIGNASNLWILFTGYFLFAVAFSCNGVLVASILIARWFRDQQSRSARLAMATTGLSLGGILFAPTAAHFLEIYGMSRVMPWISVAYMLGCVVSIVLLKPVIARPRYSSDTANASGRLQKGEHRVFWLASMGMFLQLGCNVGALQHIYNFTAHNMNDSQIAALSVSAFATGSFCARFLGGVVLRWTSLANYIIAVALLQSSTLILLTQVSHPWVYIAVTVGFGCTVSTTLMLQSLLVSHLYASHRYPVLFSKLGFISAFGMGLYPFIIGLLASRYDYNLAFQAIATVSLIALALLLLALRGHGRERQEAVAG